MIKYMLDTNICIYLIRNKSEKVLEHFDRLKPSDICISFITLAELEYGICKSKYTEQARLALTQFLSGIETKSLTPDVAVAYGRIRSDLEKKGTPIGANDLLIAAHAMTLKMTLVTNNEKEFVRVKGLKTENWTR